MRYGGLAFNVMTVAAGTVVSIAGVSWLGIGTFKIDAVIACIALLLGAYVVADEPHAD
jgi:hypothetical protein